MAKKSVTDEQASSPPCGAEDVTCMECNNFMCKYHPKHDDTMFFTGSSPELQPVAKESKPQRTTHVEPLRGRRHWGWDGPGSSRRSRRN